MIGVSPAYFFSLHGPGFGPTEIAGDLPSLSTMGYEGFQSEIFDAGAGSAWSKQAVRDLNAASRAIGMSCTAFVAHFLGSSFVSRAALEAFSVDADVRQAIEAAGGIDGNAVFALPLPAFKDRHGRTDDDGSIPILLGKALSSLNRAVGAAGMQLALELMPGNILGRSADFLGLCRAPGFEDLGLVFDTGHFWAMGEDVGSLPGLFGDRIVATHLCDNDGVTNLSLCPGDGSVPFDLITEGLASSSYDGGLDVEIVCPAGSVQAEYARAVSQLRMMEEQIARTPSTARTTIRSTP
jgi:sugar phosphate isomerase/epimerase